jgi:PAS domain S-box-containing protein
LSPRRVSATGAATAQNCFDGFAAFDILPLGVYLGLDLIVGLNSSASRRGTIGSGQSPGNLREAKKTKGSLEKMIGHDSPPKDEGFTGFAVRFPDGVEGAPDGFADALIGVYRTTPEGKVLYANTTLAHLLGYGSPEEVLEVSALEFHCDPEERRRWQQALERAGILETVGRLRRRDGRIIWVRDLARVVRDAEGRVLYYEGTLVDITEQKRAEQRLAYQAQLLDHIGEAVIAVDLSYRITAWNPAAERLFGWRADEVIGKEVTEVLQVKLEGQTRADARAEQQRHLQEKGYWRGELVQYHRDGHELILDVTLGPLTDATGQPIGLVAVKRDITEQKRLRKALQEREEWFKAIFEGSRDAIFLVDAEARLVDVNPAACELTGYSREELLGRRVPDLHEEADLLAFRSTFHLIMSGRDITTEAFLRRKDGTKVPVEFSNRRVTIQGRTLMHTTARDMSERHEAERRISRIYDVATRYHGQSLFDRAAETLADLLNLSYVLIGERDEESRSVRVLTFYHHGLIERGWRYELAGTPCETVIQEPRPCAYPESVWQLFPNDPELRARQIESYIGAPIYAGTGDVIGIVSGFDPRPKHFSQTEMHLVEIIAQRLGAEIERQRAEHAQRKLQEQLFLAEKLQAIETLAGGVAHEFNNILTGILGFAEVAQVRFASELPALDSYLERIIALSGRARDLIGQLLLFSRPSAVDKEPCSLTQLLSTMATLLRRALPENIRVETALPEEMLLITADPAQIQQAFLSIFMNARDAMPHGGRLRIACERVSTPRPGATSAEASSEPFARVTISDTGFGIPASVRPHIFDPFFSTKEVGTGTGLGLSMAYGIVKAHGGWIEVESEVDRGSSFFVYLPVVGVLRVSGELEDTSLLRGTETILLVDDEPMVREVGQHILESLGYRVLTAEGGADALRLYQARQREIDLVLLDLLMPDMNGREVCRRLQCMNPDVKVILVTGYSPEQIGPQSFGTGVVGVVTKPYHAKALATAVYRALHD